MVERLTFNQTVTGSTPVTLILKDTRHIVFVPERLSARSTAILKQVKWFEYLWRLSSFVSVSCLTSSSSQLFVSPILGRLGRLTSSRSFIIDQDRDTPEYHNSDFDRVKLPQLFRPGILMQGRKLGADPEAFSWFKEYWVLQQSRPDVDWTPHAHFRLMFAIATDTRGVYGTLGLSKVYLRWSTAFTLLLNLFFFQSPTLSFANKIFVEETMSLNWHLSYSSYKLFKYSQNLVYFRDSRYGNETREGYFELAREDYEVAIMSDVKYHEKNLFFLRTFNYYVIGLSPANYDPWELSFPIPLIGDSLLGQHYFLATVAQTASSARMARFDRLSGEWGKLASLIRRTALFGPDGY